MTVQEAFDMIKAQTTTIIADRLHDIVLINGNEAIDCNIWYEPDSQWHIWLGNAHSTSYSTEERLVSYFEDDEGDTPLQRLTDAEWDELLELLKTIAVDEATWRKDHKDYSYCGSCNVAQEYGFDDDDDFEPSPNVWDNTDHPYDALCPVCAKHIYENDPHDSEYYPYAKEIMERTDDSD
ncbi:MAG: hypothetical protein SFZ02_12285 [bacterium]|nr:hypothetical protein [bacterium]